MTDLTNNHKLAIVNSQNPFRTKKIGRFLLINLALAAGIQLSFCPSCFTDAGIFLKNIDDFVYSFLLSCFLSGGIGFIIEKADKYFPWLDAPFSRLVFDILVVTTYTFVVSLCLATIFSVYVWDYFKLDEVGWEGMVNSTKMPIIIALSITLILTSRSFLMEWRQAAIDAEQMRTERLAWKYQSLKDQLNPHFLFNSLNVLSNLVYEDADQANAFIEKLSKIYRYVLDVQYEELVELDQELAFAKNYLELQELRFGSKISYVIRVNDSVKYAIPPLTLQLLLENAVKHNAATKDKPLIISIIQEDDQLKVTNTFNPRTTEPEESGIGLKNIKERYSFLSNREVVIDQNEALFEVNIPLLTKTLS
ncbi:histidine kinase [Cryomorphaceae bacterium 1068]|nr:histidine kinase [Cryomorphaceae bacterium 1068]